MKIINRIFKFFILVLFVILAPALILREVFHTGPALTPSPLPRKPIVDMHVHTSGIGAGDSGCFVSSRLRNSLRFPHYLKAFNVTVEEVESMGDQVIIARLVEKLRDSKLVSAAILLAMDGVIDRKGNLDMEKTEFYVPNKFIYEQAAKYKELYFGASINPYRKDALDRLRQVHSQGAKLVKWIPSIQMIDPADKNLEDFYLLMKELNLKLLTHTGHERSFTHTRDELSDPAKLHLPLNLGVKVIAAHVASTGTNENQDNVDRLLPMMEEYPNLYADISSLTQANKITYLHRVLKDKRTQKRLLYGSDMPLINTPLVSPWFFPLRLNHETIWTIQNIKNVWDRDVALKKAMGVPTDAFDRPRIMFDISFENE